MKTEFSAAKRASAAEAVKLIRSGQRVFVGSGAGQPQALVAALAARAGELSDTEVIHLLTLGIAPYAAKKLHGLRHNALFIGANVREAVGAGFADYTPCFLSEIPALFRSGRIPIDVAMIQVAPPRDGRVSLGIAVDVVKAAVESAACVIAQINPRMPWTRGDSKIPMSAITCFVEEAEELCALEPEAPDAVSLEIGRNAASLINDGDTLQLGIGTVPDAVLASLSGKKDLGVHTEMFSDGLLPLLKSCAVNGARKSLHPGKVVTSFCFGSRRLYDAVADNPAFEFRPTDYVNDPYVIGSNDGLVSINSALQVDLTGQVAADSLGHRFYSGVGGQVDFVRGAARSKGGRSLIALPSTAKGGKISRIVLALEPGTGVVTSRADVDFVVTEYGIASLKGKTIRQRAVALIGVAHPDFRKNLAVQAGAAGLIDPACVLPRSAGRYPAELEARGWFKNREVFFRPLKPSDEKRLKELFYTQSKETTQARFGVPLKCLSERQFQELVAVDYGGAMAVAAFVREARRERMVGVGRYFDDGSGLAEAAFTVHDDLQGIGVGTFLLDYLVWIGRERGLQGFKAELPTVSAQIKGLLTRRFSRVSYEKIGRDTRCSVLFSDWRGTGNPALSLRKEAL